MHLLTHTHTHTHARTHTHTWYAAGTVCDRLHSELGLRLIHNLQHPLSTAVSPLQHLSQGLSYLQITHKEIIHSLLLLMGERGGERGEQRERERERGGGVRNTRYTYMYMHAYTSTYILQHGVAQSCERVLSHVHWEVEWSTYQHTVLALELSQNSLLVRSCLHLEHHVGALYFAQSSKVNGYVCTRAHDESENSSKVKFISSAISDYLLSFLNSILPSAAVWTSSGPSASLSMRAQEKNWARGRSPDKPMAPWA